MSHYEIRDEDIEAVIKYVKLTRKEEVSTDRAREILHELSQSVHFSVQDKALLDPEHLDELLDHLDKS